MDIVSESLTSRVSSVSSLSTVDVDFTQNRSSSSVESYFSTSATLCKIPSTLNTAKITTTFESISEQTMLSTSSPTALAMDRSKSNSSAGSSVTGAVGTCNGSALLHQARHRFLSKCKFPSLDDILNNEAEYPYNLASFIVYLSQNHCLETLEFAMDVKKYTKVYNNLDFTAYSCLTSPPSEMEALKSMWLRLISAYIITDAPKELNIPCEVRDSLMKITRDMTAHDRKPPHPKKLDYALELVKDMMKENAYMPFISGIKCNSSHMPGQLPFCFLRPAGSNDVIMSSVCNDDSTMHPVSHHGLDMSSSSSSSSSSTNNANIISPFNSMSSPVSSSWSSPEFPSAHISNSVPSHLVLNTNSPHRSQSTTARSHHGYRNSSRASKDINSDFSDDLVTPPESPAGLEQPSIGKLDSSSSSSFSDSTVQNTCPSSAPHTNFNWRKMSKRLKWRRGESRHDSS